MYLQGTLGDPFIHVNRPPCIKFNTPDSYSVFIGESVKNYGMCITFTTHDKFVTARSIQELFNSYARYCETSIDIDGNKMETLRVLLNTCNHLINVIINPIYTSATIDNIMPVLTFLTPWLSLATRIYISDMYYI